MKKVFIFISIIFSIILISGCNSNSSTSSGDSSQETAEELIKLKVGTQPWVGYGPWWIADAENIFEKYNLDVEIVQFVQDSDMNAAFASNNIQVASVASHTAIRMVANNGLDVKALGFLGESLQADAMITKEEYTSFKDLKGKKIAFEEGTTSDLLFRQALIDNNLNIEDYEIVYMAASDAGLALLSNKVDAAITYEPYISGIINQDPSYQLLYSGEDAPGLISDVVIVQSEYLEEKPEIKKALQDVWDEALQFWVENPERGDEIIAKMSGVSKEELPPILEGLYFFTIAEQIELVESGELVKKLDKINSVLDSQGGLDSEVNVEDILEIQ